jgi:hypothetical protein
MSLPVISNVIEEKNKWFITINDPSKLIEFVNSQLKPKLKEKNDNGEVFTPLQMVDELLDKLDESYKKQYKLSIFCEPNFKWFDPAVGIGNFPILLFQRLMSGLVNLICDEEQRRKHILEKTRLHYVRPDFTSDLFTKAKITYQFCKKVNNHCRSG